MRSAWLDYEFESFLSKAWIESAQKRDIYTRERQTSQQRLRCRIGWRKADD